MNRTEQEIAQDVLSRTKPGLTTAVMAGHYMIDHTGSPSEETAKFSAATKRIALEMNALREKLSFCTLINDWTIRSEDERATNNTPMIRQAYWASIFGSRGQSDGLWTPKEASELRFLQGNGQMNLSGAVAVVPHGRISEKYLQNTFSRMRHSNPALKDLVTNADQLCSVRLCGTSNERCASEYFGLMPVLTRQRIQQLVSFVPYCCRAAIDAASRSIAEKALATGLIKREERPFRIVNVFLDTEYPLAVQEDAIREYDVQ